MPRKPSGRNPGTPCFFASSKASSSAYWREQPAYRSRWATASRAGHQHPDWLCAGTELGKISRLVDQAGQSATPLEEKLNRLSTILIGVTLGLSVLFVVVGLIRGESAGLLIETSLALAIAAIPEGMSVVATIALVYGMLRLTCYKVLVKRLSAVSTLGETNVVFTDKTGTLTENRIDVFSLQLPDGAPDSYTEVKTTVQPPSLDIVTGNYKLPETDPFKKLVLLGILCNNANVG